MYHNFFENIKWDKLAALIRTTIIHTDMETPSKDKELMDKHSTDRVSMQAPQVHLVKLEFMEPLDCHLRAHTEEQPMELIKDDLHISI